MAKNPYSDISKAQKSKTQIIPPSKEGTVSHDDMNTNDFEDEDDFEDGTIEDQTIYMVAEGRTLILPDNTRAAEFTKIDRASFTPDQIKGLVKGGTLREVNPFQGPAPKGRNQQKVKTSWDFDPKELASKSLEELNIMVLERDTRRTPYETRQEAITQLSRDF